MKKQTRAVTSDVVRKLSALLVSLVVAVMTLVVAASAADAAPAQKESHAAFDAVSCPSPTFCMAVGAHVASDGKFFAPFADTFDGTSWHARTVSVPGWGSSLFGKVSCADRSFCIATADVHGAARAARWNGTSWSLVKLGGAAPKDLFDVQCRSHTFCMLVGDLTGNAAAAWHYNGYAWYPQALPSPRSHVLRSISCPTTKICFAAGYTHIGYNDYSYVVRWGGKGWHASSLPRRNGSLADIACLTTTRCTAVGDGTGAAGSTASGLVVDLAGGKWTYTYLSAKKIERGSQVQGTQLACSTVACTAILGYEPRGANIGYLIAVRGTSGGFTLGTQRFPDLSGLTCTGTSCIVVGSTLVDDRNGNTIATQPTSATAYRRHATTLARFGSVPQG